VLWRYGFKFLYKSGKTLDAKDAAVSSPDPKPIEPAA
jgi:hypothetical protein